MRKCSQKSLLPCGPAALSPPQRPQHPWFVIISFVDIIRYMEANTYKFLFHFFFFGLFKQMIESCAHFPVVFSH